MSLVDLGIKISKLHEAIEIQNKLQALADAVRPSDTVCAIIDERLIRDVRDIVQKRCDTGFLTLFLALVDGWLRSCEEHIRRSSRKRFADDIRGFEDAYKKLVVVATPYIANKAYRFDNLVSLFDNLGLINP